MNSQKRTVKQWLKSKVDCQFSFHGFAYLLWFSGVHSFQSSLSFVWGFSIYILKSMDRAFYKISLEKEPYPLKTVIASLKQAFVGITVKIVALPYIVISQQMWKQWF